MNIKTIKSAWKWVMGAVFFLAALANILDPYLSHTDWFNYKLFPIFSTPFIKLTIPQTALLAIIVLLIFSVVYNKKHQKTDLTKSIEEIKKRAKSLPPTLTRFSILENGVDYKVYIKDKGWSPLASDGMVCGDANSIITHLMVQINPQNRYLPLGMGITYRLHVQNTGWLDWVSNSIEAGSDQNQRIEAVEIKLLNAPPGFHMLYQVLVQDQAWTDYHYNGETAGTTGQHKGITKIRIYLIKTAWV